MATKTLQSTNRKGKFVSIPHKHGSDNVMDAVASNLEQLTGLRGGGNKKAVLWEDLKDIGFASFVNGKPRSLLPFSDKGQGGSGGDVVIGGVTVEPPTTPTNLVAHSGFGLVSLSWDPAPYSGHAYTEIYQSNDNNFSNAVVVRTTPASIDSLPIEPDKDYYYWIKFVNQKGQRSPINQTSGTHAKSVTDPQFYLDLITKELNQNPDFIPLPESIQNILGISSVPSLGGVPTIGSIPKVGSIPDIEMIDELSRLMAESSLLNAVTVDRETSERRDETRTLRATIETKYYTSTKTDEAIAAMSTQLKSTIEDDSGVIMSAVKNGFATKTGLTSAISNVVSTLNTKIADSESNIANNYATKTEVNNAISTASNIITSELNNTKSTITTLSQTVANNKDGYDAMWGVKATIAGVESSVGLIAHSSADTSIHNAQFVIKNAQFRVAYTTSDGTDEVIPVFGTLTNPEYTEWVKNGSHGTPPVKEILVINTASIKVADIKSLVAGDVIANTLVANAEINSPLIKSATLQSFKLESGEAGFGDHGPYSGFNTYISKDGTIQTNDLIAEGGELKNVTIGKDCLIEGTLFANQIVGDIYTKIDIHKAHDLKISVSHSNSGHQYSVGKFSFKSTNFERELSIPGVNFDSAPPGSATDVSVVWFDANNHRNEKALLNSSYSSNAGRSVKIPLSSESTLRDLEFEVFFRATLGGSTSSFTAYFYAQTFSVAIYKNRTVSW